MVRTKKVNKWAQSIQQARKELNVKGFVAINKGSLGKQIYQRAKQIHQSGGAHCHSGHVQPKIGGGPGCGAKPVLAGGSRTNLIGGKRTRKAKQGGLRWVDAVSQARKQLGVKGFVAINRGSLGKQIYNLAKKIYK